MRTYVNYNRHGQNVGHNSIMPHDIAVNGSAVTYKGTLSKKAFDTMNDRNLVSHTTTGEHGTLYCTSESAAEEVADILRSNPNYSRIGA